MPRRGENIRKREDGRWEGRYTIHSEDGSKSVIRSVYAVSYADVKRELTYVKQRENKEYILQCLNQEELISDKDGKKKRYFLRFADIAEEWLSAILDTKKLSTYAKYNNIYNKYLKTAFGSYFMMDMKEDTFQNAVINEIQRLNQVSLLTESVEKSIYCVINQVLRYTEKQYHVSMFHIMREQENRRKKPVTIFNILEQQKLIAFLNQDMDLYKMGVILCLHTGIRIGELCCLKWEDIDMDNRIISINKTIQRLPSMNKNDNNKTILVETEPKSLYSKREIPISNTLYRLLLDFKHNGKYLIGKDKVTDPRNYQKKFQSYLRMAGIEYKSFHTLRHTFATNCAANGTDAKCISELLGHSDVKITLNRYIHPTMDSKRMCVNHLYSDSIQTM